MAFCIYNDFINCGMNFELVFHLPFILIIAYMVHRLSYEIRDRGMNKLLYYSLLFVVSTIIYLVLFTGLVILTTERSPF
jgi:hypothetical protein